MLPNRLLVGTAWDWADVAGLRLPKRLDVGFDCPKIEDMVTERGFCSVRNLYIVTSLDRREAC